MKLKYIFVLVLIFVGLSLSFISVKAASGTSKFIVNQTTFNITQGKSESTKFTLELVSGTTWGTSIVVKPSVSGISITFNPSSGDPTFSGTMTISVSSSVPPGTYVFNISATGDNPTTSPTTITVYVSSSTTTSVPPPSTTTSPTTTTTSTTSTTTSSIPPSTTTTKPSKISNYASYVIGILVILAIIIGVISYYEKSSNLNRSIIVGFSVINIIVAIYLMATDTFLRVNASIHFYLLLLYTLIILILSPFVLIRKSKSFITLESLFNFLFFIGMLIDSFFGMPFTSLGDVGSKFSMDFFYGFGTNGVSSFSISFSFSIILILSFLIFELSLITIARGS